MKNTEIIEILKNSYKRDIRKQVVKTLLAEEKKDIPNYKLINQIFSYVLGELGWEMSKSTKDWDTSPLDIMEEAFPQIESTKWFQEQILTTKKTIDIERRD